MYSVYLSDKYGLTLMESYPTKREANHYIKTVPPIGQGKPRNPGKYYIFEE